ncbi:MAG: fibronectin type III domain-containing protein, partial [Thermoleophilaceae bacterium]
YFDFWDNIPHYYSFNANGWHFIALDSTSQFGQTASGSPMYNWLQNDLRTNRTTCMVAYWHHPPFNIGAEGYSTRMDEIWNLLASQHVAMALTGHDHDYQRWVPLDGTGNASSNGVTEFVAGTGGHSEQSFVGTDPRVAAAFSNTQFGALRMELNSSGAAYQFVTAAGQRLDSGSVQCPGSPKDTTAPTTPSGLTATAKSRAEIDLSWNQSNDNVGVTGYDIYRNGSLLKSIGPDTTFVDGTVSSKSTYTYTVKARDAAGHASPASNSSSATTPALGVLFYDGFETNDLTQWTSNTGMTTVPNPMFSGSFAAHAVNAGANQATWVTKKLAAPQTSVYYAARVRVASQGTSPVNLMRFRSSAPNPANLLSVSRSVNGKLSIRNETTATTTTSATAALPTGSWHTIQAHVVINGASSQVETWFDGVKVSDLSFSLSLGTASIGPIDLGEFTKGRTYDVTFDEIAVDTNPIPDVTAPTAPTSVQATSASGLQVDLSWAASSDDVGIAAYDIYRNGALVASPTGTSTTWSDTTVSPQSSYFYQVRARDGAGNTSALSELATVTTGPAFSDGFETGDMSQWTTSAGITPQSATGFSGSYAARATASLAAASASKTLPSAPAELFYRVRFKIISQGATSPINLLRFRTAGGLAIYTVSVGSSGALQARNDVTGVTTSSTASVAPGVWHELQAHLFVQGATGQSDLWLDGIALPTFSRADNFGSSGIGRLELGDSTGMRTFDVQFDDVLAASSFIQDDTPPTPPANLTASSVAGNQVTLSWIPATDNIGVTSYDVYRNGLLFRNITPTSSYTDTSVQPAVTYLYEVRANDAAGNTSEASNAITVTTPGLDTIPPTAPTGLTANAVSPTEVDLSWNAATDDVGVTSYKIFRNDNVLTTVSGSSLSYQDRTVAGDNSYSYTVEAVDAAGNSSPKSGVASATTPHQSLFVDGFESGSLSPNWAVAGGLSVQQQQVATGAWAAHATTTSAATWAWHALPSPQADVDYSVHFKSASAWSGTTALLKLRTGTGTSLFGVQVSSAGKLQVRNDVASKTTASTTVVSTGTWHLLEAHLVVAGTSSTVSVTLDGTPVSGLSLTDDFGTTAVQRVQFGDNSGGKTFDLYFDDIAVEIPSAMIPPVNAAPPLISGTATDQSMLTASTGSWTGSAPMVPGYQWRDCDSAGFTCIDIPGATGSTYTLRASDVGQTVKVVVTETNAAGSASAASGATAVVTASPPSNTIRPTITGTAGDGEQLTAARGTWSGSTPITYAYQWRRCDSNGANCTDIASATDVAYSPTSTDVGSTIVVAVIATNGAGFATAASLATTPVGGVAPANTSSPSISGGANDGQTLTADHGDWNGSTPITYGYQWRRCDTSGANCTAIPSATAASYTLTSDDVGSTIIVAVTASNSGGSSTATSSASGLVAGIAPANTTAPSISGSALDGQTLTADHGDWNGSTPITYAYQWRDCDSAGFTCTDIAGATDRTYVLRSSDVGQTIMVAATATNSAGFASATSGPTAAVAPVAPANIKLPTVTGSAKLGATLTANAGTWSGTTPITYAYQWQSCAADGSGCADLAGATAATYGVQPSDFGNRLHVVVTASNGTGASSATSADTDAVVAAPVNTAAPTISGTPDGVSTLSADSGTWSGSTPIDYAYQWQSCASDGSGCVDINNATSASYRPTASDVGNALRVQVTASNVAGSAQAASDVTAPVSASGPANTTAPSISGTMLEGQTLTADNGTWTGTAPIDYAYQWRHCNSDGGGCTNVAGATSPSYVLSTYDSGATLDVLVTATNTAGSTFARSATVALRTPLFAEGFESGTLANWTSFGLTTQQTNVFAGSWAARSVSTAGTASYATAVLPTAQSDLTYRLHFKGNSAWPSTGVYLMKLRTATNASIVGISVSGSGRLAYRNDVAAASTTTTTTVSSGVWHEIAVHVTIAGTSGSIDMTLDGTHPSGLPKTENFGTALVAKIQVGDNSTGRNFDVASDEVVVGNGG